MSPSPEEQIRDLWEELGTIRAQLNTQNVLLAEIKTLLSASIVRDIEKLQREREEAAKTLQELPCDTNTEKLRTLERIVWGTGAAVVGLLLRALYEYVRGKGTTP